jgi:pimeloyl-ACP methyl ester carboxylesterase
MRVARVTVSVVSLIALALHARPVAAASCESLASLTLQYTAITAAETVAAGAYVPPAPAGRRAGGPDAPGPDAGRGGAPARGGAQGRGNQFTDLPAFCRVAATIKPSADSNIRMELWMPASGWNGKFVVPGNGGFAGTIAPGGLATALRNGYAAATTDTGHEGGSGAFMLDHPERLTDFADRAIHETTVRGKAILGAFYGSGPRLSYFNGCSTGGRQALTAAQRFPNDYDGIVAGAPAIYASRQSAGQIWIWQATHQNPAGYLTPEALTVLHNAAVAQCDALDGVKDGVLEDPRRCTFDPKVVQCKEAGGANCLTAPQVEAARKIYTGARNPRTGELIFSPLYPGSELGWASSAGAQPVGYAADVYKYVVMRDANWDPLTLNYDSDIEKAEKVVGQLTAIDPDLTKLLSHGKLLIYAGWSDPGIPPGYITEYYKNVIARTNVKNVRDSARLFMVPGMGHCGGGDGTSTFDMLAALDQWVEKGKAPDQIPASRVKDGVTDRTRPLCPYPQVATYKGSGSIDEAASFACRER